MSPKYTRVDIKPPQGGSRGSSIIAPLVLLLLLLFLGAGSITMLLLHPWNNPNIHWFKTASIITTVKPKTHSTATTTHSPITTGSSSAEYTNSSNNNSNSTSSGSDEVDELLLAATGGEYITTDHDHHHKNSSTTPTRGEKLKEVLLQLEKLENLGEKLTGLEGEVLVPLLVLMTFLTTLSVVSLCCCVMARRREARRRRIFGDMEESKKGLLDDGEDL